MIGFITHFPAPPMARAAQSPRQDHAAAARPAHVSEGQGAPETLCPYQQALERYLPLAQMALPAAYVLLGLLVTAWVLIRLCVTHPTGMMLLGAWVGLSLIMALLWWMIRGDHP